MDIPDAFINIAIGLLSAGVGGGITGYYTLKATDKAIRDQNDKERRRDEKEIDNLLDALGVELSTLWKFHMKRVGERVEKLQDGQPLDFYYPLTQDYFTIYDSNAGLIGRIPDCAVSEAIVVTYNKCKKVVDGFKYNNELVKEYRHEKSPVSLKALADYAAIIKEDHFELKGYADHLLGLLASK